MVCSLLIGCTFGGSDEDPSAELGAPAALDAGALDAGDPMDAREAPPPPRADSGGSPVDRADASEPVADASAPPAMSCEPTTPFVTCDPVHNTGCPPLTQCDVDPAAATLTGRCVFFQAPVDATMCSASVLNTSCEAESTCIGGACQRLCYCDSDCPVGNCCSDGADAGLESVLKLCQPC